MRVTATPGTTMTVQKPSHILIIDDEESTIDLYAEWLRDRYIVSGVTSGDDALTKLSDSVDIVVLDRDLTEWTGTALLRKLRNRGYDGPVVMVTGTEPSIDIVDLTIDEYLVKPTSRDELVNTVRRLIQIESYDNLLQEYYSLVSKLAVLHATNPITELSKDDRYTELCSHIAALEAELDEITSELTETDYYAAFRAVVK